MSSLTQTTNDRLSGFRVPGEIPVPLLINWMTAAAVALLLLFGWRSLERGQTAQAATLAVFAVVLTFNGLGYLLSHHTTLHRRGFITIITVLFSYLAVNAIEDGSAILWLFAYPAIIFYISEARVGLLACSAGLFGTALLFSPLGSTLFELPYTTGFKLTMLAVLTFVMTSCYALDQSRRRSKLGLLKLAEEFEYAAKHDTLTGLANRLEAHTQLDAEFERYRRNSRPFSVLLMDIDLFKSINDNHGHHVGDEAILVVARTLEGQSRKVDTLSRWGGEEFLLLLPETHNQEAAQTAERIRLKIAATPIHADNHTFSTSVSIGVATITGSESVDRLLQRADEALYAAKAQGRNLVRCFGPTSL